MAQAFKFTGPLIRNLAGLDRRLQRNIVAAAHYTAPQAEAWMKTNAKWTDRTGAARSGLGAQVVVNGDNVAIIMYHSVSYGVFLELRWGGKYAVLEPAMAAMGPVWMAAVKRLGYK